MNQQEFEDTARRYREEMFRLYANPPTMPQPVPVPPPMQPSVPWPAPLPAPADPPSPPMDLPAELPVPDPQPKPMPTATGGIKVRVSTARGARPVENAVVTVVRETGAQEHLYALRKTNSSGETQVIPLPAPPAAENLQAPAYFDYNIHVYAPGYYRESAMSIPVFADVVSLQAFDLIPLPAGVLPTTGADLLFYNHMKDYTTGGEAHAQW